MNISLEAFSIFKKFQSWRNIKNVKYSTSGEALNGLIGLGGGDTVGKYLGTDRALFPSCFVTLGVIIADNGGGIMEDSLLPAAP